MPDVPAPDQLLLEEASTVLFSDGSELTTLQEVNREIIDTTVPELANVRFYADAADAFNASERRCPKCDTVQPEFPTEIDTVRALRAKEVAEKCLAELNWEEKDRFSKKCTIVRKPRAAQRTREGAQASEMACAQPRFIPAGERQQRS